MRIAFDQQIFTWQEYGGISRYICRLAAHLSAIVGVETKIFAPLHVNSYLPELASGIKAGIKVKILPKTDRIRINASRLLARPLIQAYQPDIVHETYYSASTYAPKTAFRVLTAYDMIHEQFKDKFLQNDPTTWNKKISFSRADHIICISESTKRDLLDIYDVSAEKVSVVYLGFDSLYVDSKVSNSPVKEPYLLYVGQRGGYKNFDNFIKAYARYEWLRNNFRIYCFGGGAFTVTEKESFKTIGIDESRIHQLGGDDSVLTECYRNASAFVYPSLYEGFGIPPLEAMSLGCPVVCSNTSSIPEVVGNSGEYFDPNSVDSIGSSIENVLNSSEHRSNLIIKGFERCKLFTWEKCAAETLVIYKDIRR